MLRDNLRKIGLLCLFGIIITGLAGCSSYVPEPVSPKAAPANTVNPAKPPGVISLQVDQTALTANGLDLNVEVQIMNHYSSAVDIENPAIRIQGVNGVDYCQGTAPGGQIGGIAVEKYNFRTVVPTTAFEEKNLTIKIDFNSKYDGKVLPGSYSSSLNLREILNKLYVKPTVSLAANVDKISSNGVGLQVEAQVKGTVDNPNPFDLVVNSIKIAAADQQGNYIGDSLIEGSFTVAPNSDYPFKRTIILPFQSLNDPIVTVVADIPASSLFFMSSLSGETTMQGKTLEDLIKVPKMVLQAQAKWDNTQPVPNLELTVNTSLTNDNPFNLTTADLVVTVNKPNNTVLTTTSAPSNTPGIQAFSTKEMTNVITLRPDTLRDMGGNATINANIQIGMENLNETIPVSSNIIFNVIPPWPY